MGMPVHSAEQRAGYTQGCVRRSGGWVLVRTAGFGRLTHKAEQLGAADSRRGVAESYPSIPR